MYLNFNLQARFLYLIKLNSVSSKIELQSKIWLYLRSWIVQKKHLRAFFATSFVHWMTKYCSWWIFFLNFMFRLLEKMADESVPVPETEPLNLHEDLKKLEDEINTLKQVLTHRGREWTPTKEKRQIVAFCRFLTLF